MRLWHKLMRTYRVTSFHPLVLRLPSPIHPYPCCMIRQPANPNGGCRRAACPGPSRRQWLWLHRSSPGGVCFRMYTPGLEPARPAGETKFASIPGPQCLPSPVPMPVSPMYIRVLLAPVHSFRARLPPHVHRPFYSLARIDSFPRHNIQNCGE